MTAVSTPAACPDEETTISPEHLSITTRWPSGGARVVHLERDSDLCLRVDTGLTRSDGRPLRYDVSAGYVLVLLGIDEDHDQVRVQPSLRDGADMIETLRQTIEACQISLNALCKINGMRI